LWYLVCGTKHTRAHPLEDLKMRHGTPGNVRIVISGATAVESFSILLASTESSANSGDDAIFELLSGKTAEARRTPIVDNRDAPLEKRN